MKDGEYMKKEIEECGVLCNYCISLLLVTLYIYIYIIRKKVISKMSNRHNQLHYIHINVQKKVCEIS